MVNEWYYEKKTEIHQRGFNLIAAEELVNIFKKKKFGYLSLRSVGLYLPACTLHEQGPISQHGMAS